MDQTSAVKVSILTPAYNHAAYVEQAIRSAWAQTHRNVEHIIVDDRSSDATPSVIDSLVRHAPFPTKFLRNEQNLGPGATVNRAFSQSSGDWICFLASDDAYAPWKLEHLLRLGAALGPSTGVIHGDCWSMNEAGLVGDRLYSRSIIRPASGDVFLDYAMGLVGVNGLGVLIRRDVFSEIGGNDPTLLAEDFDFYLRLARVTRFAYLDEGVAYVRNLPTSLGRNPSRYLDSIFLALERQRDALGGNYAGALHSLHLRAFDTSLGRGPSTLAAHHAAMAVRTSATIGDATRATGHMLLGLAREYLGRRVARAVPESIAGQLRRLNRQAMRWVYRSAGKQRKY